MLNLILAIYPSNSLMPVLYCNANKFCMPILLKKKPHPEIQNLYVCWEKEVCDQIQSQQL